jgi:hypothetical protein
VLGFLKIRQGIKERKNMFGNLRFYGNDVDLTNFSQENKN